MRCWLSKFLFLVCVGHVFAGSNDAYGILRLVTYPKVTRVRIDDSVYTGNLPERFRLKSGSHKIFIENPDRIKYQQADFIKTIELAEGQELELNVTFHPLAEINSYPYGASVISRSEALGETPMYLDLSKYKSTSLEFIKAGYETLAVSVNDSSLAKNYVFVKLEPKIKTFSAGGDNQFHSTEWKEQGPRKHKETFWLTTAAGLLSGGLSAFYKYKADNAFEDAKIARRVGDNDRQDKLEKKTQKYDNYALAGFVGLQVNFAAIIYLLLKR